MTATKRVWSGERAARRVSEMGQNGILGPSSFPLPFLFLYSVFPIFLVLFNPNFEFKLDSKFKLILIVQFRPTFIARFFIYPIFYFVY